MFLHLLELSLGNGQFHLILQKQHKKRKFDSVCRLKKYHIKAMHSSYLEASVYPPLPRCVALKKHNFVGGRTAKTFGVEIPQYWRKWTEINSRTVRNTLVKL